MCVNSKPDQTCRNATRVYPDRVPRQISSDFTQVAVREPADTQLLKKEGHVSGRVPVCELILRIGSVNRLFIIRPNWLHRREAT